MIDPIITAENGAITGPVNVAIEMPDNGYLNVRVTDEGVIFDAYVDGALVGTSASTFTETFDRLTEGTD